MSPTSAALVSLLAPLLIAMILPATSVGVDLGRFPLTGGHLIS
jgi:hypothetical protein